MEIGLSHGLLWLQLCFFNYLNTVVVTKVCVNTYEDRRVCAACDNIYYFCDFFFTILSYQF